VSEQTLDFDLIKDQLDTLLIAAKNLIERDPQPRLISVPGGHLFVLSHLKISESMCRSVRYLCADHPGDPLRKREFALAVPPMARSIADSLCAIVFSFDNLPVNLKWFWKSLWRELVEEQDRYQRTYGGDPAWSDWLAGRKGLIEEMKRGYGISLEEESNPRKVPYWPNPGKMARDKSLSSPRASYLGYLNDWFYKHLSSASHLSGLGLFSRANFFFEEDEPTREDMLEHLRTAYLYDALVLLLALISEFQLELELGLADRAKYIWTVLGANCGAAKELFEHRYATTL
jgi:hypothetical protein